MTESETNFVMGRIESIALNALVELDSMLKKDADYESKNNFFMTLIMKLIEVRGKMLDE